jgi:hypothetical protein
MKRDFQITKSINRYNVTTHQVLFTFKLLEDKECLAGDALKRQEHWLPFQVQTKTIPLQPWTNPLGLQEAEVPKMS